MSIKTLLAEAERNVTALRDVQLGSETYSQLVETIDRLLDCARSETCLRVEIERLKQLESKNLALPKDEPPVKVREFSPEPFTVIEEKSEEEPKAEFPPEDVCPFETPTPELAKTYAYEEVRAMLAKARVERKVDINSLITGMGYEYLSSVPAEKYGELLAQAGCV